MHGMYAAIPQETDIKLCMMSQGYLCMFEEPLYLVDKIDWCLYALFINDLTKIELNCKFITAIRHTNLAHSLDGYLWAISSLATEKLQIRCIHQTSIVTIEPPLRIIDIGNGCEAFSSTIYIPAKSELTTTMQSLARSQFFSDYNFKYAKMSSFVLYHEITFAQLTPEEVAELQSKVQTLEPMNMKLFNQKLKLINENYPLTLPPWVILGGQVISSTFILTEITLMVWFCLKHPRNIPDLSWKWTDTMHTQDIGKVTVSHIFHLDELLTHDSLETILVNTNVYTQTIPDLCTTVNACKSIVSSCEKSCPINRNTYTGKK